MDEKTLEVVFLGTNGSCSYNNGKRDKYGVNTSCVAVCAEGITIVFDAGSGICGLNGNDSLQNGELHLFFSHYHVDHICGLLFWGTMFNPAKEINIYGPGEVRAAIDGFYKSPYQPVGLDAFRAKLNFRNFDESGGKLKLGEGSGVSVTAIPVSHPDGCLAYRVDYKGKSVCYIPDIELVEHKSDDVLAAFVKECDLLIIDSSFEDGKCIKGWGHSSPRESIELAIRAGVKKLALFHYEYSSTDERIDTMEKSAQALFANTFASADGLTYIVD